MPDAAVFISDYTIQNSPSIINLIEFLAGRGTVDVYVRRVSHRDCGCLDRKNIRMRVLDGRRGALKAAWLKMSRPSYGTVICIDPQGFVMCREVLPHARPIYYSLELYMSYDHLGLSYPKALMEAERRDIGLISGLIIQSDEKDVLFREDYGLKPALQSFILPVTYDGPGSIEKSGYLRERYGIPADRKVALHLGGIAEWFSCIEMATEFACIDGWSLVFHGYPSAQYLVRLRKAISDSGADNVYITDERFDEIDGMKDVIRSCDVGIAWYNDISTGFRTAGESSGKIPAYMRFGLPVVAKRYPSTERAIESPGAGLCVEDLDELPEALGRLLDSYAKYSGAALAEYSRRYDFNSYRSGLAGFLKRCATA